MTEPKGVFDVLQYFEGPKNTHANSKYLTSLAYRGRSEWRLELNVF